MPKSVNIRASRARRDVEWGVETGRIPDHPGSRAGWERDLTARGAAARAALARIEAGSARAVPPLRSTSRPAATAARGRATTPPNGPAAGTARPAASTSPASPPTDYPASWAPSRAVRPAGVTAAGADRSARHAVPAVDAYPAGWVDPQQRPAVVAAHGARPATATIAAAGDRVAYAAAVRAAEAERYAREAAGHANTYSDGREGLARGSERAAYAAAVRDAETERYRREVWER